MFKRSTIPRHLFCFLSCFNTIVLFILLLGGNDRQGRNICYSFSWQPSSLKTSSSPRINHVETIGRRLSYHNNNNDDDPHGFRASSRLWVASPSNGSDDGDDGTTGSKRRRFKNALPQFLFPSKDTTKTKTDESTDDDGDLDRLILKTAVPSMINLGVVPIVNSVDTFWVGRVGVALALAGQSAANQATFTVFFLIAFLPNITAPLVAKAVASGDLEEAQTKVCESLFLSNILGFVGTVLMVGFPRQVLGALVMDPKAPAMDYAAPYLRWRALGMVPDLVSATGSAAYRGLLDTVTPLKVSLMTNVVNLILDPLLVFPVGMGFVGAAIATAAAELTSGLIYLRLLLRRKLARWKLLLRPTSFRSLLPLLQGGASMLIRQLALNVGFLVATRRAQTMDPSGVMGAAYGITMQIYSVGIIMLIALQTTASALVPSKLAKYGNNDARQCADRLFTWSSLAGCLLGLTQYFMIPILVPVFSTLPEVREAARMPALIASLIHLVNGPLVVGEGVMIGLGSYKDLALITIVWIASMVTCLASPLGKRLDGIMWSILISNFLNSVGAVVHYLKFGPLATSKKGKKSLSNR